MYTYDEILERMEIRYEELSGHVPDEASDIGIRLRVLAGEVFALYARLEYIKKQIMPSSADGDFLESHALMRGLQRKNGVAASGVVTFYTSGNAVGDVRIPKGTVVSTAGSGSVRFKTVEEAVISSGTSKTDVMVEALVKGVRGNVGAGSVCLLVTPAAGIVRVSNASRIRGGSDIESDDQLRNRILNSYKDISNGTNRAYYIEQAMSVSGVWSVGIEPRARGAGTVNVYIADRDGTAENELIAQVQSKLDEAREINVDVLVKALAIVPCDVNVVISVKGGYDHNEVSANVAAAVNEYFLSLQGGQTVYLSEIGGCISNVEGVANYTFVKAVSDDIAIAPNCAARLGNITITERD